MKKTDLTFILAKGEKIIAESGKCTYAGAGYIQIGSGLGTQFGSSGVVGGIFGSEKKKREGSIFDAKTCWIYLTNKRIIFCNMTFFGDKIENPFSEIYFKQIKGINESSKLGCPAIGISVANPNGEIDNIKILYQGWGGRED
mgnify:CR=1 FL=1